MSELTSSLLSNDSMFGKIMTRIGIIISANIMFCIFSLPVFTIGSSYTALYHVMFRTLREGNEINPFKEFWFGFKNNFKQSTICWLIICALFAFGYLDVFWCKQIGGILTTFQYAIYALGIVLLVMTLYIFPTISAFHGNLADMVRNAFYFALSNPFHILFIAAITVFPQLFTYADTDMLPLYGFFWVVCGYALTVLACASLLIKQFRPYLSKKEEVDSIAVKQNGSEKKTLKEMKKINM